MSRQGFIKIIVRDDGAIDYQVQGNLQQQDVILVCDILKHQYLSRVTGGKVQGITDIAKRIQDGLGK